MGSTLFEAIYMRPAILKVSPTFYFEMNGSNRMWCHIHNQNTAERGNFSIRVWQTMDKLILQRQNIINARYINNQSWLEVLVVLCRDATFLHETGRLWSSGNILWELIARIFMRKIVLLSIPYILPVIAFHNRSTYMVHRDVSSQDRQQRFRIRHDSSVRSRRQVSD